jgi:hypothetical protein
MLKIPELIETRQELIEARRIVIETWRELIETRRMVIETRREVIGIAAKRNKKSGNDGINSPGADQVSAHRDRNAERVGLNPANRNRDRVGANRNAANRD